MDERPRTCRTREGPEQRESPGTRRVHARVRIRRSGAGHSQPVVKVSGRSMTCACSAVAVHADKQTTRLTRGRGASSCGRKKLLDGDHRLSSAFCHDAHMRAVGTGGSPRQPVDGAACRASTGFGSGVPRSRADDGVRMTIASVPDGSSRHADAGRG